MGFSKYIFKKILFFIITLFLIITITFILMKLIPGDPFSDDNYISSEAMDSLRSRYGLDQPFYIQYFKYLKGIIVCDLGSSLKYDGITVNEIIKKNFPISAILGLFALPLSIICGIALGSIAAFFRNKWQDRLSMVIALLGMSVPSFIMATFLQYTFALKLQILPIARWGTFSHIILPVIALSFFPSAFIARLTRANIVEVLEQDYILAAKSKGLSNFQIWKNHVLKNSLLPIVSYLGSLITNILIGSFVIEKIFGIPGLGCWLVNSIANRDYTIIMGLTIFYSLLFMSIIFFIDILYFLLDPRIKRQSI